MKNRYFIFSILLLTLLSSCFKEDEKVMPHDPGDVETMVVDLSEIVGSNVYLYRYQKYFDLNSGQVVSSNMKKIWDLGFECSPEGWHIRMNTSSFMVAAHTGTNDFEAPIDTTGFRWKFDTSDGNLDSTAIGSWVTISEDDSSLVYTDEVYVIDRGYDELGNVRGLRKVVFQYFDEEKYIFKFANMDGSGEIVDTVFKDPSVNYMCYSFDNGGQSLPLEPSKFSWDLLFTQYTTLLFTDVGDPYPYLVTGVLLNRQDVEVAQDTLMDFFSIDINSVQNLEFNTIQDEIGYDWKDIVGDPTSGTVTYVIIEGLNYIIRDQEGYYYKIRFIDFYSDDGIKGYPKFEYQRL